MNAAYNVFISWSGKRSLSVAQAIRSWLPKVIQVARPWMSDSDIEKGSRGINEISSALGGIKVGICCLTPENLAAPWLVFEAGALSKSIDDKTRLCTYLFGGLQFQDVRPPLSMFQATRADKEDTRKLIHAINNAVQDTPISESDLDELFDAMWPNLERSHIGIPPPDQSVEVTRSTDDMVAEILDWARAEPQRQMGLAADIANRLAANRPDLRQTVALKLNINGKPLNVEVAGLYELAKPALKEYLLGQMEGATAKVVDQATEKTSRMVEANIAPDKQTAVAGIIGTAVGKALREAVERLAERSVDNALASVAERLWPPGIELTPTNADSPAASRFDPDF